MMRSDVAPMNMLMGSEVFVLDTNGNPQTVGFINETHARLV